MADEPHPPIISDERSDIQFYPSVADAQIYVEAVDVRDGVYEFFDSIGNRLSARIEGESVYLELNPMAAPEPDDLARRLRAYVFAVGPERIGISRLSSASLRDLVVALARFFKLP